MASDFKERGRVYFPGVDFTQFTEADKIAIEADIKKDFDDAYAGILQLPQGVRLGVYLAYIYYIKLFQKIKKATAQKVASERIRVPDGRKIMLLLGSAVRHQFNML